MNATVYPSPRGFYVKYYVGDSVVDEAGPFEDAIDAEESAHRWADHVSTKKSNGWQVDAIFGEAA